MEKNKRGEGRDQGKEMNFQWFIISFLIHWHWFVISVFVFLLGGFIYLRYATPVYDVSTNIVLRDSRRGGLGNSELSIYERLGYIESSNNILENELEILRSRDFLEAVVTEEEAFIRYYVKGRVKNTEIYRGFGRKFYAAPPVNVFLDNNVVSSLYTVLNFSIALSEDETALHISGQYGNAKFTAEFSSLPGVLQTPIGEILLLPDENVALNKDYPLHVEILPPLWVAQSYMVALSQDLVNKSATIVRLSVRETNPRRGERFLARMLQVYDRETTVDKNRAAQNASEFIQSQLIEINHKVRLSEMEVQKFKQENQIALDVSAQAGIYVGDSHDYIKRLIALGSAEIRLDYLESEVLNNPDDKKLLPAVLATENQSLFNSLERYNQTVQERERLLAYTRADVPIIRRATEQIRLLREDILSSISNLRYANEVSRQQYEDMIVQYEEGIEDIPRQDRELSELLREQIIQSNLYIDLLSRKQEIDLTLSVSAPGVKIIERPMIAGQVAPQRTYIWLMCLSFGLVFPFVVIGLRELLNYRLTHEEEVRRFADMPVIVSIPTIKTKSQVVVTSHATTAVVERFRLLRTNLQFILDVPEKKSILITSTISGEGKTFVAINLAITFSLKYKTILVGLDIRRPKINTYLNLPKQMGLISYLTGVETNINNLIYRNVNGTNLDVLISGMVPLNPNELLIERTLDEMFKQLREQYDYIIIDSSPVGSVSDAFLLNRVCDASLFVVRNNLTPKSALSLINKIYEEKRLNSINLILNGFAEGKGRYGYGYGYGYSYGYGYGYESSL
jgi:capsular exopolysaccharide synthesis family protein